MTARDLEEDAEKPLDPAAERLRRKMVRLLAVSIGLIFIALMAVLGAVVYKIGSEAPVSSSEPVSLDLPAGAVIEDMALDDRTVALRVRENERERLLVFDLGDGRLLRRLDLVRGP